MVRPHSRASKHQCNPLNRGAASAVDLLRRRINARCTGCGGSHAAVVLPAHHLFEYRGAGLRFSGETAVRTLEPRQVGKSSSPYYRIGAMAGVAALVGTAAIAISVVGLSNLVRGHRDPSALLGA